MGLDTGADDYLVRPFAPAELLVRIRALLRLAAVMPGDRPLTCPDLRLDPATRETRRGDRAIDLSPKEFDLLACLLRHARQVLPPARMLEAVWGEDFFGDDNMLDAYIGHFRQKTEAGGWREDRVAVPDGAAMCRSRHRLRLTGDTAGD